MAKKKGVISNSDKVEELSSAENALRQMQLLEAKKKKQLQRVELANGYALTTDIEKWKQ